MRYTIGSKVFGDWEIVAELGEGSFGKVFRLEKNTYKIKAASALKVLTVPRSASEVQDALAEGYDERSVTEQFHEIVEKLVDEIAVMAKLKSHPHIVSVEDYTVIEHENAIGWDILIRMELLTSLQDYQRMHPMDETAVRQLGLDICEALAFCKEKNLMHRDIKPGNVFVDSLGQYKLGDFGVARTAEKTMSGMSKQGTENYMAPEVYFGREYGPNVDIYSLGMMLYRLMNKNRLPFYPLPPAFPKFKEKEQALIRRLKGEVLPPPCDAGEGFARIILKACEADPKKRYHTADEMLTELKSLDLLAENHVAQSEENWEDEPEILSEDDLEINHYSPELLRRIGNRKSLTQDELTEIMSTIRLTPDDMIYLMRLLREEPSYEDEDSFESGNDVDDDTDYSLDEIDGDDEEEDEDPCDKTDVTVSAFGFNSKGRARAIEPQKDEAQRAKEKNKGSHRKSEGLNGGLDQYLLNDEQHAEEENDWWREDSTDRMHDHKVIVGQDDEDDEDATVSVFQSKKTSRVSGTKQKDVQRKEVQQKETQQKKTQLSKPSLDGYLIQNDKKKSVSGTDLKELNLPVRAYNVLTRAGIHTIEELCALTRPDVRAINNLGPATLDDIQNCLAAQGYKLSTGKSQKQIWRENKTPWMLEYWKKNLPRIYGNGAKLPDGRRLTDLEDYQIYFAPNIPAEICSNAIYFITEYRIQKFGSTVTLRDGKTKAVQRDHVLGILDLSAVNEKPCTHGVVVTADAIYLHLGGSGKEATKPVVIPYEDFSSGWKHEAGGLLKSKRTILHWRSRQDQTNYQYESSFSDLLKYDVLLECLQELSKKHR